MHITKNELMSFVNVNFARRYVIAKPQLTAHQIAFLDSIEGKIDAGFAVFDILFDKTPDQFDRPSWLGIYHDCIGGVARVFITPNTKHTKTPMKEAAMIQSRSEQKMWVNSIVGIELMGFFTDIIADMFNDQTFVDFLVNFADKSNELRYEYSKPKNWAPRKVTKMHA